MRKTILALGMLLCSACIDNWLGGLSDRENHLKVSFTTAAAQNRVPVQLLLATAWLESRLTADAASVVYDADTTLGIQAAETAFGLTRQELARFSNEDADLTQLDTQVAAYARLLRDHLDNQASTLRANTHNNTLLLEWVRAIAELHRTGDKYRRNARSLFALEMLAVLNSGFQWRDSTTGEEITLLPHHTHLKRAHIPYPRQQFFNLRTTAAQLYQAHWLQATNPPSSTGTNRPRRILITHCPFSLSTCLELQNTTATEDGVALQAHYIIPANPDVIDYPLQVTHHDQQVLVTSPEGQAELQQDTIVIMLSGNSGRIVNNIRVAANPMWQSGFQLEWLGYMVKELCNAHLALIGYAHIQNCSNPQHADTRVVFRRNQTSATANHRWGEIADFDRNIYAAYLQQPLRLQTQFTWLDQRTNGKYNRGETVRFTIPSNGRNWYVLEKLVRCPNNRLLYVPVAQQESNARGQQQFSVRFYDRGPNGDGKQFLRAKVFRQDILRAWAIDSLTINHYDEDGDSIYYEGCDTR